MIAKIKLSGCNLNCSYCPPKNRGGEKTNDSGMITAFINAAKENNIKELKWSGGEPTIYSEFLPLVRIAHHRGFYQSVSTNGTFPMVMIHQMRKAGFKQGAEAQLKIDRAWAETYDKRELEKDLGLQQQLEKQAKAWEELNRAWLDAWKSRQGGC